MAIADTRPPDKKSGEGTDADVEQQLTDLVALVERIDWREVDGISTAEAAALAARLADAEVSA